MTLLSLSWGDFDCSNPLIAKELADEFFSPVNMLLLQLPSLSTQFLICISAESQHIVDKEHFLFSHWLG